MPDRDATREPPARRKRRAGRALRPYVLVALLGVAVGSAITLSLAPAATPTNVTESVSDEVGTPETRLCKRAAIGRWNCEMWDPGQSGDAREYRVAMEGDGCWKGRIVGNPNTGEGPLPARVDGCLDNVRSYAGIWVPALILVVIIGGVMISRLRRLMK